MVVDQGQEVLPLATEAEQVLQVEEVPFLVLEEVVEDIQEQEDTAATCQDTVAVVASTAAAAVATIVAVGATAAVGIVAANYSFLEPSLD